MIDCKIIAKKIKEELKPLVAPNKALAIIQVGDNAASNLYVRNKMNDAKELGVLVYLYHYGDNVTTSEVIDLINELNMDSGVKGIIVQLPLPEHLDSDLIVNTVSDEKDIDGFKVTSKYTPCTPKGIMTILDHVLTEKNDTLVGKNVVVIGKGKTVGRPLINLLLDKGATVTSCNSKTKQNHLNLFVSQSDIVISAVGKPNLVGLDLFYNPTYGYRIDHLKTTNSHSYKISDLCGINNKIIIDVGISRDENGKQIGDCSLELREYCDNITGWTNAVGLMTRMSLFQNLLQD